MKNRLFIIEGLPCSGKSTISAFVASCLQERQKRELRILSEMPVKGLILDDPQTDWRLAICRTGGSNPPVLCCNFVELCYDRQTMPQEESE